MQLDPRLKPGRRRRSLVLVILELAAFLALFGWLAWRGNAPRGATSVTRPAR